MPRGDLLVIHATDLGAASFSIANPSGFFAARARPDHYEELARWIGLFAIAHAEARWQEIGVAAYAAELGLTPAAVLDVRSAGARTQPAGNSQPRRPYPEPRSTAREALLQLEELRAGGLVTPGGVRRQTARDFAAHLTRVAHGARREEHADRGVATPRARSYRTTGNACPNDCTTWSAAAAVVGSALPPGEYQPKTTVGP